MTPVRFQFETDEPVYPLRVAGSSHATAIPMELYVVTPYRPAAETYEEEAVEPIEGVFAAPEDQLEIRYSAPLTATDRARLRSPGLRPKRGAWLTRYEAAWAPATLTADLLLTRAPEQEPISFALEEDPGFSPTTTIALIAGMAVLILVGVAVVSRRRSSRRMFR